MLKKRYKWGIAISILLTEALLTGCSDYLEDTINPPSYHEMGIAL